MTFELTLKQATHGADGDRAHLPTTPTPNPQLLGHPLLLCPLPSLFKCVWELTGNFAYSTSFAALSVSTYCKTYEKKDKISFVLLIS